MEKEWKTMHPEFTVSPSSIELRGHAVAGADDRQHQIVGFDQKTFSASRVLFVGAGGLTSNIAPTLVRKGIGAATFFDADLVEASNLNRQQFYEWDIGHHKAIALPENLQPACIAATELRGFGFRFEEAVARHIDMACDVAVCAVDNNPARVAVSRHFRALGIPVIFSAVSRDADHGYVFVQGKEGPCIACLFPDMVNDDRYPCPGTPAVADILQAVGALAVYAVDTLLMNRQRSWNYRRISLSGGSVDGASLVPMRERCPLLHEH
jgi:molybdopterin/thiamine biosynthesis adenylyltransferase